MQAHLRAVLCRLDDYILASHAHSCTRNHILLACKREPQPLSGFPGNSSSEPGAVEILAGTAEILFPA